MPNKSRQTALRQASEFEVRTRFRGFSGLFGTGVTLTVAPERGSFLGLTTKKIAMLRGIASLTRVRDDPENPQNLVRTSVMDAG
jgi:hypothetical protein